MKLIIKLYCLFFLLYLCCLCSVTFADVTLQWNSVAEADGYKVYYGPESRNYQAPEDVMDQTIKTLDLDPGIYYFAVTAYNDFGESGYSEEVGPIYYHIESSIDVATSNVIFPNSEEFNGTYFGTTDNQITISWAPLSEDVTYDVRLYDLNKKQYLPITTVSDPSIIIQLPRTGAYKIEVKPNSSSVWAVLPYRLVGWIGGVGPIIFN